MKHVVVKKIIFHRRTKLFFFLHYLEKRTWSRLLSKKKLICHSAGRYNYYIWSYFPTPAILGVTLQDRRSCAHYKHYHRWNHTGWDMIKHLQCVEPLCKKYGQMFDVLGYLYSLQLRKKRGGKKILKEDQIERNEKKNGPCPRRTFWDQFWTIQLCSWRLRKTTGIFSQKKINFFPPNKLFSLLKVSTMHLTNKRTNFLSNNRELW